MALHFAFARIVHALATFATHPNVDTATTAPFTTIPLCSQVTPTLHTISSVGCLFVLVERNQLQPDTGETTLTSTDDGTGRGTPAS